MHTVEARNILTHNPQVLKYSCYQIIDRNNRLAKASLVFLDVLVYISWHIINIKQCILQGSYQIIYAKYDYILFFLSSHEEYPSYWKKV